MNATAPNIIPIHEDDDLEITSRSVLPYTYIKDLGVGGSAFVSMVQDKTNGRLFAHKIFRRYSGSNLSKFKEEVQNEVRIIQRLSSHPHIIRVFATYACGREFGMILTPVADSGDLASYLQTISDSENPLTNEQRTILQRAFGCLANGLAFIHQQTIRHKDIKPQNVLIHQGHVIYTDFGIALDASQYDSTTTAGTSQAHTLRYCAPEVANSAKRNRKSDIFSLGCVFTEILAVLEPEIKLGDFGMVMYHKVINDLRDLLNRSKAVSLRWSELIRICVDMLEPEPNCRISADRLLNELNSLKEPKSNSPFKYFCDSCAPTAPDEGSLEALSSMALRTGEQHQQEIEEKLNGVGQRDSLFHTLKGYTASVRAVAFSPDGKLVASGSTDGTVRLWDSATGVLRSTLEDHTSWVLAVAFSPDGKLVASGFTDGTVRLWDSATGVLRSTLEGHTGLVWAVSFSPDGKLVASASTDRTIRLWGSATGVLHSTLEGHTSWVRAVSFSPDGKLVASGSNDGTVRLWDSATGVLRSMLEDHTGPVWAVPFSPDGKLVASGSDDRTVRLWDSATGVLRSTLEGHTGPVWAVSFSPDGKLLASGSDDRTVRLWDLTI